MCLPCIPIQAALSETSFIERTGIQRDREAWTSVAAEICHAGNPKAQPGKEKRQEWGGGTPRLDGRAGMGVVMFR